MSSYDRDADALADRLFGSILATMDLYSVYLGDRLGFYRALSVDEPITSEELASRTGTHERYAREWLEQQAVTGFVEVQDHSVPPDRRPHSLSPAQADVLTDPDSRRFLAPGAQQMSAVGMQLPALLRAFRKGGGVPWDAFGEDMRDR